ncbi:peptidoglycan-associated lipoprotein Pal [Roseateles depolymerans]|uniref:Peptidoglycan-associated lipoprotein n=1 Tax=Roseateles depolymerans TaxID=76731 RepID=A0A0U3L9C1_9BURK|nr:peptidoglycan-associated lipoprotein Pal [Roseateles depolymerans]ALV07918.1 peptidoglycan-binding protein [Roseateles depolymerans]REG21861.1 peptidoglycan-associated lipoprotein [Roseateles depolymerans]
MKIEKLMLGLVAAAALAACSSTKLDEKPPVETAQPVTQQQTPPQTPATPERQVTTVDLGAQLDAAVANQRTVYFDFDSYVVKDEYRNLIETHAKRLNNKKSLTLSLEGHTDERGGREYNLALGQKRAEAVAKSLTLLGVASSQVEPVSFGKERPADNGHTEEAWAKNRRVELRDK